MPVSTAITCPSTTLAAGASETCTALYLTTVADLTNGFVSDSAVVTATTMVPDQTTTVITSVPSTVTVPYLGVPATTPPAPSSPIVPTSISVTG